MRRGNFGSVRTRKLPIVDNGDKCLIDDDSFNVENIPDAGIENMNRIY